MAKRLSRVATEFLFRQQTEKSLQHLMGLFVASSGLPVAVMNPDGKRLYNWSRDRRGCTPCSLMEKINHWSNRCRQSHRLAAQEAVRWGETYISRCELGLVHMAAPIMKRDKLICSLIAGPFVMRLQDRRLEELGSLVDFDAATRQALRQATQRVPVINGNKVKSVAELLFSIADHLSLPDLHSLRERRALHLQQAKVAEEIHNYKATDASTDRRLLSELTYDKEKELIVRVRLGDKPGARKILNEFLGLVLLQNPLSIEIIKAYVLELVTILTRAAVEEGANLENILGLRFQYISELAVISSQEQLCLWVVKVMESIVDNIYNTRNVGNFQLLQRALTFIDKNYARPLTLQEVAKEIYVSSFHFSHIIKKELNVTFVDYLTRKRIDAAKILLRESQMSLAQIALEVGYSDQSYFTKVFKKLEGITPKAYRRLSAS